MREPFELLVAAVEREDRRAGATRVVDALEQRVGRDVGRDDEKMAVELAKTLGRY